MGRSRASSAWVPPSSLAALEEQLARLALRMDGIELRLAAVPAPAPASLPRVLWADLSADDDEGDDNSGVHLGTLAGASDVLDRKVSDQAVQAELVALAEKVSHLGAHEATVCGSACELQRDHRETLAKQAAVRTHAENVEEHLGNEPKVCVDWQQSAPE